MIEIEAVVRIMAGMFRGQRGIVESIKGRFAVVWIGERTRVELSLGVLELAR